MNLQLNTHTGELVDTPCNKLTAIHLHGPLGKKFGKVHHLAVTCAAEAIYALGCMLQGFDAYLTQSKDRGEGYAVFYGMQNLAKEELGLPVNQRSIRIVPMILGAKNGGWLQIILGAVLIIVGVVFSAYLGPLAAPIINMGIALIVGGVVQLLTPQPKGRSAKDRPENEASANFNGAINTQAQGNPVALLYGELFVGSFVLSAGIDAKDHAYSPDTGGNELGYGGGGGGGATNWT